MKRRPSWIFVYCLTASTLTAAALLAALGLIVGQSLPVFVHSGIDFILGSEWYYRDQLFGALPMIYGTVAVSAIALILALPIGVGSAVFASEYMPRSSRLFFKSTVELLAGVPSVIYGLIGVLFVREWVYRGLEPFDPISGDSLLTAGILLAVMILPTVTTLSDDALRSIPSGQRAAARSLGLTRAETILRVVLPQAAPGILTASLLGLGRAMGETIAVFLVVGRQDNQLPGNPFSLEALISPGQTLTSKLGGPEVHIAYGDPLHWAALLGLSLILLLLVGLCLTGAYVFRRFMRKGAPV
ncbi:MAG: phosphate ABC transporter permease subunit PstC [Opitutales bacterium]